MKRQGLIVCRNDWGGEAQVCQTRARAHADELEAARLRDCAKQNRDTYRNRRSTTGPKYCERDCGHFGHVKESEGACQVKKLLDAGHSVCEYGGWDGDGPVGACKAKEKSCGCPDRWTLIDEKDGNCICECKDCGNLGNGQCGNPSSFPRGRTPDLGWAAHCGVKWTNQNPLYL